MSKIIINYWIIINFISQTIEYITNFFNIYPDVKIFNKIFINTLLISILFFKYTSFCSTIIKILNIKINNYLLCSKIKINTF